MGSIGHILRSGSWLTAERVKLVSGGFLIAYVVGVLALILTANGLNDVMGRPLGTDFSSFYTAGSYALQGNPAAPYDNELQHEGEKALFGAETQFYSWLYPPIFLLLATPLAALPYIMALTAWLAVTFGLYLAAIRSIIRSQGLDEFSSLWLLVAAAYPAVFLNLGHGQNGFLSAALLGGALAVLDRRPVLAGVLFGCLAYKPQLGLVIPIVLMVSGRWRTFAAAAATVIVLIAASYAIFGAETWRAFFDSTRFTREVLLEAGDVGWNKIQSVFAWARMWGAPVWLAYAIHAAVAGAILATLIWIWRNRTAPYPLQAAALCIAVALVSPFSLDYDMMALAPGFAFLVPYALRHGFAPWEKTLLAALWLVPVLARGVAQATLIPLGVLVLLAAFWFVIRRAFAAGWTSAESLPTFGVPPTGSPSHDRSALLDDAKRP